jgi:hypothetical protein
MAWSSSAWFFSLAAFAAVSLCAFWNQFQKAAAYADNQDVLFLIGRKKRTTLIYVALSGVLFLIEGMIARSYARNERLIQVLALVSTIVLVSFVVRGSVGLYPQLMRKLNSTRMSDSGAGK